jgi:hypothetical protein
MDVRLSIRGEIHTLTQREATITAEELRRKAAGQLGTEGVEGAAELADAIEARLTGERDDPITIDDDQAEALFYLLEVTLVQSIGDPNAAAAFALYDAVRAIPRARLRHDAGPPLSP